LHQVTHKTEIKGAIQVAIEVVRWHKCLQRDGDEWSKGAFLVAHHGSNPPQTGWVYLTIKQSLLQYASITVACLTLVL
jgi:hypothetical protein